MPIWDWLLNPSGLTAHGFCLSWAPGLVALHAFSDLIIGLSYFSIPLAIVSFVRRRTDLEYGWIFDAFVGFIVACGTTHILSIVTLWVPAYGIEGIVKAITAVSSVVTAIILWPLIPRLLALPSPDQLMRLNADLALQIENYEKTARLLRESEARGRLANIDLERRVLERTADLEVSNVNLAAALAQRAEAEQALARSEAEFRASFEQAAVGKMLKNALSRSILRVNRTLAEMLGYEPSDLIGRKIQDFTWPADKHLDMIEYERLLAGEINSYMIEKRYIRSDGSPFWVRVSATLAHVDKLESPMLTIVTVENIDSRYKAEAELRLAKQDLERLVEERTLALEQRDILLREVYHRVKNNLQVVDGLLMMQAQKWENGPTKDALIALRGRVFALGLVHHQLMSSEDLKTFDIKPFLDELIQNIVDSSINDNVSVSVDAHPLAVGLDFAIPLGLLVTELVTNSVKHAFTDRAGNVSVSLHRDAEGTVVLVVSDDGSGQETAARPSTEGMGSRIIKGLVSQIKGTMIVTNLKGSTTEIRTRMMPAS